MKNHARCLPIKSGLNVRGFCLVGWLSPTENFFQDNFPPLIFRRKNTENEESVCIIRITDVRHLHTWPRKRPMNATYTLKFISKLHITSSEKDQQVVPPLLGNINRVLDNPMSVLLIGRLPQVSRALDHLLVSDENLTLTSNTKRFVVVVTDLDSHIVNLTQKKCFSLHYMNFIKYTK